MAANEPFTIFIGYDSREAVCSYVASHSIKKRTRAKLDIKYLNHRDLRKAHIFSRPWIIHGESGETTDLIDGKTFSTEFSHTRFLVPHLMGYTGWALFMDADMIFLSDIKKLMAMADDKYAVMCVKHHYNRELHPHDRMKMDSRSQRLYTRKNWSSFVLWNCGHPENKAITPEKVNFMHGGDLHAFGWLKDESIGPLPYSYNYISGVSPKLPPDSNNIPSVMHYSDGGPWFEECIDVPFGQEWIDEYEGWQREGAVKNYSAVATTRFET